MENNYYLATITIEGDSGDLYSYYAWHIMEEVPSKEYIITEFKKANPSISTFSVANISKHTKEYFNNIKFVE